MQRLDAQEVRQAMERDPDVHVIHVLDADRFLEKHVPGSVNVPVRDELFVRRVEKVARGKDGRVIVYCDGGGCDAAHRAACLLEQAGFGRVQELAGGVREWEAAGYPLEGAQA